MSHFTTDPASRRAPSGAALLLAAAAVAAAALAAACAEEPEVERTPEAPAFAAMTRPRSTVRSIAADTLTEAARVVRLVPEPDGRTVAVLFADTASGVSAGLGFAELGEDRMQLLWPDSVTDVWWSGPHSLAFTTRTGQGVRVVVDVHAESIAVLTRLRDSIPGPASAVPPADDADVRARATTYVDSIHAQAGGEATRGELTYAVTRLVPQPGGGDLVAVHVIASARDGRRSNPAWYLLDRATDQVTRVDAVVGPQEQLPAEAAGWTGDGTFLYAKGLTIWSAEPTRRGVAWRGGAAPLDSDG